MTTLSVRTATAILPVSLTRCGESGGDQHSAPSRQLRGLGLPAGRRRHSAVALGARHRLAATTRGLAHLLRGAGGRLLGRSVVALLASDPGSGACTTARSATAYTARARHPRRSVEVGAA